MGRFSVKIERFEDIEAWKHAREMTQMVYEITKKHGFDRDYRLIHQITDAAGSAMHNIAEGFDSHTHVDFARFLGYAQRSCSEVQSQLYVAIDQEYIDRSEFKRIYEKASDTKKTIGGFIKYLRKPQDQKPRSTKH